MSNSSLFMKSGFPRAPLNNGIGRYVCQLQRITIKFCKSHGSSKGVRDFIETELINYAKENPGVVVYIKPRRHRSPIIKAEYLNGKYHWLSARNFVKEDILKWMELMRTQDDDGSELRLRKFWHTEFPSIQGPWTPFTFKDPAQNLVEYPNEELSAVKTKEKSATDRLLEMYKAQKERQALPVIETKQISN
ncbi:39S ribosomal protein L43, mitochondrial [Venturia canescens]|uniref:39S ribosomal protein L43, mitochondrial n=1 Tax=Venturia canescens TaxID=32260 RepID=UPI001C9D29CF|nr:39S ribosomal protein L43, mitochondrial [Venturia canescens]